MILKKIRLNNIRSYVSEEITFPEGNLLLAGNIGSGKSTVLLAIDFVLFGLRKDALSGASLLRVGTDQGDVELHFVIDGKDVVIKRVLKKGSKSISQSSGYIIIDGYKKELSALELKQFILDLLNYPQELLTKSKSMIFHYTVYTPQEEMKRILTGEKDIRLDTLRKIFGIDKYKLVGENAKIFLSGLREKTNEFKGRIERLGEKQEEKNKYDEKRKEIESKIDELNSSLEEKKKKVDEQIQRIKDNEIKADEISELKKELSIVEVDLKNKQERIDSYKKDIEYIKVKLETFVIEDIKEEDLKEKIEKIDEKISNTERSLRLILDNINISKINEENSHKIIVSIQNLDVCPTCKQEVNEEYKKQIVGKENQKILKSREELEVYNKEKKNIEQELQDLTEELKVLKEKEKNIEINNIKKKEKASYELRKKVLNDYLKELETSIERLIKTKKGLIEKVGLYEEFDIEKDRKELENMQEDLRDIELQFNSQQVELKNVIERVGFLEKEIEEMNKIKRNLDYLVQLRNWIGNYFVHVVSVIEKNVMFKIHSDFNTLFQKWFDILVDNENLKIDLDKEFTPLITQGGHDLDYLFLSGGEKNAAALSYRLALNQVINNLVTDIKTKDLLILDEPTDGFSEEQLDRMRLVLEELNIKQIVLVSHEAKIESFVDNVIRFKKENNVSAILK